MSRIPHPLRPLVALAAVAAFTLTGCVTAEPPVNTVKATAGAGRCKLPALTVEPTTLEPGGRVKLTGQYFVDGCGGGAGATPLELISAVLTDANGTNLSFPPIDSEGEQGTFAVEYDVPREAAKGPGRITVGRAGPVPVVVED